MFVRIKADKSRLSPLVMFAHTSQTFGGTARRGIALQTSLGLQTRLCANSFYMGEHPFAESKKSANRKNAPWFRVNFAFAKFQLGEAQYVLVNIRSDKAINLKGFWFFLPLFLSKRKRGYGMKAAGFQIKNRLFSQAVLNFQPAKMCFHVFAYSAAFDGLLYSLVVNPCGKPPFQKDGERKLVIRGK